MDGGRLALPLLGTTLLLQGLRDWSLLKIKKRLIFSIFSDGASSGPL
jgi:hypothetical protein